MSLEILKNICMACKKNTSEHIILEYRNTDQHVASGQAESPRRARNPSTLTYSKRFHPLSHSFSNPLTCIRFQLNNFNST